MPAAIESEKYSTIEREKQVRMCCGVDLEGVCATDVRAGADLENCFVRGILDLSRRRRRGGCLGSPTD